MLSESWASVYDVGFPKNWREILRSASDSGHGESLSILIGGIIEVIFTLPEINEFELTFLGNENISGFKISMADAFTL